MACSLDKNESFITSHIEAKNMQDNSFKLEIPSKHQFNSIDFFTLKDAVILAKVPTKDEEASFAVALFTL